MRKAIITIDGKIPAQVTDLSKAKSANVITPTELWF